MVEKIRLTEKILGSSFKFVSNSEAKNKKFVRKSIVAKKKKIKKEKSLVKKT